MIEIWKCLNPACGLRFNLPAESHADVHCPRCRSSARLVSGGIAQRRIPADLDVPLGWPGRLEVILDNLRSAWNVGSIFRSADGAGVARLHLCGITPDPENPAVRKTALGAEKCVPWVAHADGVEAARALRSSGAVLWALEGGPDAEPLIRVPVPENTTLALVVGSELGGVDPGILDVCDRIVYLPMAGTKTSLNVAVACGIAIYLIRSMSYVVKQAGTVE